MAVSKTDINPATGKMYAVNPSTGNWDDNYWAQNEARFNAGSSAGSSGSYDIASILAKQQAESEAKLAEQATARTAFNTKLQGEESTFLNKFRTEYPTVLSGLESTLGIPGLREQALGSTQALGDISSLVRTTPQRTTQAARGFDVGAGQLERMTAAEVAKLQPSFETATRGAETTSAALSSALGAYSTKAQEALLPYSTELDLMKDRFAREATGFNTDAENELNTLMKRIETEGTLVAQGMKNQTDITIADINRASALAQKEIENEKFKNAMTYQDLGNRVAILDVNGKEIGSMAKGKLGTIGDDGF
jgi:hypothetical protein